MVLQPYAERTFFVTRLKSNADMTCLNRRSGRKSQGVVNDQQILLNGIESLLRLVEYTDPMTDIEYRFVTNAHHLKAAEIADIYRERWKIELFFKWIKQNLKIKTFLGTSENAVLTQIWIALCVFLLVAFLKFKARIGCSLTQIFRFLQLKLFARCQFLNLLRPPKTKKNISPQITLWRNL